MPPPACAPHGMRPTVGASHSIEAARLDVRQNITMQSPTMDADVLVIGDGNAALYAALMSGINK